MYNPIEYIINRDDPRFDIKVKTIKHHFPPGVKILDIPDVIKNNNLKNVYLDSETHLDGLILPVSEYKIIKFKKNNDFEVIN